MAVPKRKTTPSKRGMRRAHDRLNRTNVVENQTTGEYTLPHHVSADGYYRGERVVIPHEPIKADETDAETL